MLLEGIYYQLVKAQTSKDEADEQQQKNSPAKKAPASGNDDDDDEQRDQSDVLIRQLIGPSEPALGADTETITVRPDSATPLIAAKGQRPNISDRQKSMDNVIGSGGGAAKTATPMLRSASVVTKDEELEDASKPVGPAHIGRLMRMNAGEWPYILLGIFGALVSGAGMPVFALVFAEVLGVFALCLDEQEAEALKWSLAFVILGAVLFVANTIMCE